MRGGAFDQRETPQTFHYRAACADGPLADRADVLVFQTAPLQQDLCIGGAVSADLWVSSDAPDTDFTVKLIDAYPPSSDFPDGFAMNISDGILRLRYRDGWDRETFMTPGEIYKIVITPFDTCNLFRRGHRLRIDISSSNYPQFDINPNTGAAEGSADRYAVATNRVHFGAGFPSCIRLSVLQN
jgi:putative CocE/NonD family hydrolase